MRNRPTRLARKAAEAKSDKERTAHKKLDASALQQANAVRKGVQEEVDYVARYASSAFQDGAATRAVSAQLKRLRKPPPLPRSRDNKEPGDEIAEYLDRLPEYTAHVQQVRAHAERFSPEQIKKSSDGGRALQQELAALETDLNEVGRKRRRRGGARIERSGKAKENQPRRYGVAAEKRRPRAKALPA